MDMKVQGSSSKALGIGELFASACSASAPLDRSYYHTKVPDKRLELRSG